MEKKKAAGEKGSNKGMTLEERRHRSVLVEFIHIKFILLYVTITFI